jgi:DNA-binding PadR family transcriptional regulator
MGNRDQAASHLPLPAHLFEILLSLSEEPLHGYALIGDIRRRTGGAVTLGTSSLYAAIYRLRRDGLVTDVEPHDPPRSEGAPRRTYRITPLGRRVLRLEALRLQEVAEVARRRVLERGR